MSVYDKTKPQSSKGKAQRFNNIQFVQLELDDKQKKACKEFLRTIEEMEQAVDAMTADGYRISMKWDDYSRAQAAYIQHSDPEHVNGGLILSGRGSTPLRALRQALYKHAMICKGTWPRTTVSPTGEVFDD